MGAITEPTDAELVRAMSESDSEALRILYERHAAWIAARLTRRCADRDAVADALQDAFFAAWKGAKNFRSEGEVTAWLWGIAVRRLVSRLRGRGHRPSLGPALLDRDSVDLAAEEQLLLTLEYADMGRALARIAPELRVVLQATVLDGLTTREAAQLLHVPQGTVKTRLMRARAQLREELA
jgi:RNA polymerase sigma-70 factor (ECF subfamily)